MNSSIAQYRMSSVIKSDSITASQGDFLATHVAMDGMQMPSHFEYTPHGLNTYSEQELYDRLVVNPENRHRFVAIYGVSGTGKSHLIRWFDAKFRSQKPSNEVVLFIRRSDNTLKGTIRQLLSIDEVKSLENKELYKRLISAAEVEDEEKLKGRIYYDFINEVENDDGSRDITINNTERKRIAGFLKDDYVKSLLMSSDGPVERIYSRIAEGSNVDRDTYAQFEAQDFIVSQDLFDEILQNGSQPAQRQVRKLMADDKGAKKAEEMAAYLNQFVDEIIQRSTGILPGDFRDIFQEIRQELYRIKKNLTLFIEDVTSFTGVDEALLDALLVDHNGMNTSINLCRISSFVGTTSDYLGKKFRDNHRDRITDYIYIPDGVFNQNRLYEFVGRYLNVMSLPSEEIDSWANNGATVYEYPIHQIKEGANWEFVSIEEGKQLCLYPFTRHSIDYFYAKALENGQRTPRYIIRYIIEPVVNDILYKKSQFPSSDITSIAYEFGYELTTSVHMQVSDNNQATRLLKFLTVWGDGTPSANMQNGVNYVSSIREDILAELNLPQVKFDVIIETKPQPVPEPKPGPKPKPGPAPVDDNTMAKIAGTEQMLNNWVNEQFIDISATGGSSGVIRTAIEDLEKFVLTSVDWRIEGLSQDNINKIRNSSRRIISLQYQTRLRSEGFYVIPCETKSLGIIRTFIRWRLMGNQSWNYDNSDFDVFLATSWINTYKSDFIAAFNDKIECEVSYIQAAINSQAYKAILTGSYKGTSLGNFSIDHLLKVEKTNIELSEHNKQWKSLVRRLSQKSADENNADTVRKYFDLPQGSGGNIIVLDRIDFEQSLKNAKKGNLELPLEVKGIEDSASRRKTVFDYYWSIHDDLQRVAYEEKDLARSYIDYIDDCLYDSEAEIEVDEETIRSFVEDVENFYKVAGDSKFTIAYRSPDQLDHDAEQISNAIEKVRLALKEESPLSIIMAFATDPLKRIKPLYDYLLLLNRDLEKLNDRIHARELDLKNSSDDMVNQDYYREEISELDHYIDMFKGGDAND